VLSWRGDDDAGTLTFVRAPAGAPGDQGL
jgi:hypothetical protein